MHPEIEHLRSLPIVEKLRVIEELWDTIGDSDEAFPLPDWHREEAVQRMAELKTDPSIAITSEELWRRVNSRNG